MNILFLQHNPSSRTGRIAHALTKLGHRCSLLTRMEPRLFNAAWAEVRRWETPAEFLNELNNLAFLSVDIWHVHLDLVVEWIVPLASKLRAGSGRQGQMPRIVLDARDIRSMVPRNVYHENELVMDELVSHNEIASFQAADGVVHVSRCCQEHAENLGFSAADTTILLNMPSMDEWAPVETERAGLVYSGGLSEPMMDGSNDYRNWSPMVSLFAGQPGGFHLYPADSLGSHRDNAYRLRGGIVHERVPDADLVGELTRYKWGLVGFPMSFPLGEAAGPNKFWEYVAAGVIPAVLNCHQAAEWVREHKCGVWARSPEVLLQRMSQANCTELSWNLLQLRARSTMELQIPRLVSLYKRVCGRPPRVRAGVFYSATGSVFDYALKQWSPRFEFVL